MTKQQALQIFNEQKVRTVWDDETEEWYFSVVDVVQVLTDSNDPKQYVKKLKTRDPELSLNWGTICTPLQMLSSDGKRHRENASTMGGILRIIQSIPSPKAEPFKQWMAQVAAERLDQLQNPELSINQAIADYQRLGYSENWINQRIKTIEVRKQLTDEWKRTGVKEGQEYASLTDIITKAWSDRTTKQYKQLKGLHKENLRDNMTNVELLLNALAEASTTELSKQEDPQGYNAQAKVAKRGGSVAKAARKQLEGQLGHSVVTSLNMKDYKKSIEDKCDRQE